MLEIQLWAALMVLWRLQLKKINENEVTVYWIPPSPKWLCQDGALMDACDSSAMEALQWEKLTKWTELLILICSYYYL